MCGISGIWSLSEESYENLFKSATIMSNALSRRGPDSHGYWSEKESGLIISHRRLSILDLSDSGGQPMISKNKNLVLPIESLGNKHVYYNYVIRAKKRQKLINYLKKNNIETKIIYPVPVHMMKPYKNLSKEKLVITSTLGKQILSLPIYPGLDLKSQNKIIKTLNNFK